MNQHITTLPPYADPSTMDILFHQARTFSAFDDRLVDPALLRRAVEIALIGPTAMNSLPMRVMFLAKGAERAKLLPFMSQGNLAKTEAAPITAVVGHDTAFFDHMPQLFPHFAGARDTFASDPVAAERSALQSSALQIGYLIIALRSLGLDCGPMAGFKAAEASAALMPDGSFAASLVINIGYGKRDMLHPRLPRLAVDQVILTPPV
ncbi:MAG: malonic semialdehyde reductase [Cypionkella sp.]